MIIAIEGMVQENNLFQIRKNLWRSELTVRTRGQYEDATKRRYCYTGVFCSYSEKRHVCGRFSWVKLIMKVKGCLIHGQGHTGPNLHRVIRKSRFRIEIESRRDLHEKLDKIIEKKNTQPDWKPRSALKGLGFAFKI